MGRYRSSSNRFTSLPALAGVHWSERRLALPVLELGPVVARLLLCSSQERISFVSLPSSSKNLRSEDERDPDGKMPPFVSSRRPDRRASCKRRAGPLALLKEAYLNQVKGFRAAAILANGTGAIFRAPVDPKRVSERVLEAEARRSISSPAAGLCLSRCLPVLALSIEPPNRRPPPCLNRSVYSCLGSVYTLSLGSIGVREKGGDLPTL